MKLPEQVEVEGVEHTSVPVDGFDAHVALGGPPAGEPVILLHGWPLHWWSFRDLIRGLAHDGRRVIAPDLRGFGWSGTPGWGYANAQFVKDLFALLDALGLDRVDLVGHDWGCFVGYRACLEAPARFRRYVGMSAPSPHAGYHVRTIATFWRYWYQQPIAAPVIGRRTVRRMGSPRSLVGRWIGLHRTSAEVIAAYMLQFDEPARVDASVALYRDALRNAFTTPLLPQYRRARLHVPTLHVHGAKDGPTSPTFVRAMAARSDDWRLELLDGVGHFLLDEAPEQVERHVRTFLAA
jgi:pimeloyl-ACP methyl ester carboxylesterase